MNLKPSQPSVPLTKSGLTPSVTGLALQRIAAGPDTSKYAIAGGKIHSSMPEEDFSLLETSLRSNDNLNLAMRSRLILEIAEANLKAGISFLERQHASIQGITAHLADAMRLWKLSRTPGLEDKRLEILQTQFREARDSVMLLKEGKDRNVPLFSDGQSSPIRLYHPSSRKWQLILIDRSNLHSASMVTFTHGKIYGDEPGFHLDYETLQKVSDSLREPDVSNRMQHILLSTCLAGVIQRKENEASVAPPTPSQLFQSTSLLRSSN